jgi:hypothetical protein
VTDIMSEINAIIQADEEQPPVITGYPGTGDTLPYTVHRPLYVDVDANSVTGEVIDWDFRTTLYACAASVEASFNLALALMALLSGARVGDTTLSTSMGYSGAPVEGHYESQVTVQLNQGVLT